MRDMTGEMQSASLPSSTSSCSQPHQAYGRKMSCANASPNMGFRSLTLDADIPPVDLSKDPMLPEMAAAVRLQPTVARSRSSSCTSVHAWKWTFAGSLVLVLGAVVITRIQTAVDETTSKVKQGLESSVERVTAPVTEAVAPAFDAVENSGVLDALGQAVRSTAGAAKGGYLACQGKHRLLC